MRRSAQVGATNHYVRDRGFSMGGFTVQAPFHGFA
jgi:hypothetical protein